LEDQTLNDKLFP